ncbi:MAG: phosphoenolpyruvate carboxykinase (ATP) [Spirochaetales bacterium]|nr:phosphoenolpyruvate carboxykinase (ATP) [Spirochaetales bacterium]
MILERLIDELIANHPKVQNNLSRELLIHNAVEYGKALVTSCGALATWTPAQSTGRSPKDTLIVKRPETRDTIDWTSDYNNSVEPETFDMIVEDAIAILKGKRSLYITDRVIGADTSCALPVRTLTNKALTAVFCDNMFRPVPEDLDRSIFSDKPFTLIVVPYDFLDSEKYNGRLRRLPSGKTSDMVIATDFDRRIGVVVGSAYMGSVKKLMFTAMNYYLPAEGILPIHSSANEDGEGNSALILGLSGTGKTTLSSDPARALIGDDEHGWSERGIANFEYGCYAKLNNLKEEKEPEIYHAIFHEEDYMEHGAIIENAMMYPDGVIDLTDERLTPNSRASYPQRYLSNVKMSGLSEGHPGTILFLVADANGVIPPVAKLNIEQAKLWFLMGYTSKLAGTETGIVKPVTTFSRFFGEPFMPRMPMMYSNLLGEKIEKHKTNVYLINTGWCGGPYGIGKRIDISITRRIVYAAISGELEDVGYEYDELFHVNIPKECPGVDPIILKPFNAWIDKTEFNYRAENLAEEFSDHFNKAYGHMSIDTGIKAMCPGKYMDPETGTFMNYRRK